jgi:hypothetical protein
MAQPAACSALRCSGRRQAGLPHQHEHRGRDAHNRQRGRHADALGHVPQLRHRARVHLSSISRQPDLGTGRHEASCVQRCRQGCTCCMCFSRSMQCGTHAIVQWSSFCTLSKDVNMADTSLVMEMTTCRVEHDVLLALCIHVRLQRAATTPLALQSCASVADITVVSVDRTMLHTLAACNVTCLPLLLRMLQSLRTSGSSRSSRCAIP